MRRIAALFFSLTLLSLYFSSPSFAQTNSWSVTSPNNGLTLTVGLVNQPDPVYPSGTRLYYKVTSGASELMPYSPLGLTLSDANLVDNLSFISQSTASINESYTLKVGKRSNYINKANELKLIFQNSGGKQMTLVLRAYDDGVAYRYELGGSGTYNISSENSGFRVSPQSLGWGQRWQANYETLYDSGVSLSTFAAQELGIPMLFKTPTNHWLLLAEAGVYGNYLNSHLSGASATNGLFKLVFPSDQSGAATGTLPFVSPWRAIIAGNNLATIVESTLVTNLNPAPIVSDSAVKPGRVAWSWWSDNLSPKDLNKQKAYVDFAAQMGWEYVLIDEGWSDTWVPEIVAYAKNKNVDVILWFYHGSFTKWTPQDWMADDASARSQFNRLKNWGVKNAKIDFMDSDKQGRTEFYDSIGRTSAEAQIGVNFHGATKPSGQNRKFPYLLTWEGVQGAEFKSTRSSHTTTLPFVRNVVGAMDFTPVVSPLNETSAAHQLALTVIFESPLQHMADSKEKYLASPAKDFLMGVPTTWDETRFIDGYPGSYIVLARRKGANWYLAAITSSAKTFNIPLSFLNGSNLTASIYKDGATNADIVKSTQTVGSSSTLSFSLPAGGGASIAFSTGSLASPSPSSSPNPADVNGDGSVGAADLRLAISAWMGASCGAFTCDLNGDSRINGFDFGKIISQWGH